MPDNSLYPATLPPTPHQVPSQRAGMIDVRYSTVCHYPQEEGCSAGSWNRTHDCLHESPISYRIRDHLLYKRGWLDALQPARQERHYRCALIGALQHQANPFVTTLLNTSPTASGYGA